MILWGIADPHLSISTDKPMDVFGDHWEDHHERMAVAWREQVRTEDVVLLPGDISWAMTLDEAEADLRFLHDLPGQKIIGRGNHDYWWTTLRKIEDFCADKGFTSLSFMRHNAFILGDEAAGQIVVCGTRGWINPTDHVWQQSSDERIYLREVARLKLALDDAASLRRADTPLLVALHYPPFNRGNPSGKNGFMDLMRDYGVDYCIFGHVHGPSARYIPEGDIAGIHFFNVASDYLQFKPLRLWASS
ncbi:MAG TPA: serine/threonine protein phosphatase [Clostridiaceae bacterium]|nr:serine/threonine protein phosphatase [Clostridiaceae bacterium]